ncbi:MucR family transcriptional regulator [Nocardioides sp. T5]|uniref:MucR family transcriptional regulator n=1 Tax=Nocardioides sp. T5 TaxID=3400182 RepID=UPI003A84D591
MDRLNDDTWVYAPVGGVLVVDGGARIVCHACGDTLEAITRHHVRRHDLDLAGYRARFGLNRKTSLIAPALVETRRAEGLRRWESNDGVRDGLAVGQAMARSGELHAIGIAAQPAGSRRRQGRRAASRADAAPALAAHRSAQADDARERWTQRAQALGFDSLDGYLADRRATAVTPWRVRNELRCGSEMASRLLEEGR